MENLKKTFPTQMPICSETSIIIDKENKAFEKNKVDAQIHIAKAKEMIKRGEVQRCREALKKATDLIKNIPMDDKYIPTCEINDIKKVIVRVVSIEKICESYLLEPEKTKEFAFVLSMKTKERAKKLASMLSETL